MLAKYNIEIKSTSLGEDLILMVGGGDTPHIGGIAVAVPYKETASVSYYSVPGHKDTVLASPMALKAAKKLRKTVVVVLGIHVDDASEEEIREICERVESRIDDFLASTNSENQ